MSLDQKALSKTPCVAVLGMHRSGTSAMAGLLSNLGIQVGQAQELLPATEFNQQGYYENRNIVACNEAILCHRVFQQLPEILKYAIFRNDDKLDGFGWLFGAWTTAENHEDFADQAAQQAVNLYFSDLAANTACMIKDPRLCLTLKHYLKFINIKAAIIMVRDPKAVAKSLFTRDRITPNVTFDLWRSYMNGCLTYLSNIPHLFVNYEKMMTDPKGTLQSVIELLNQQEMQFDRSCIDNAHRNLDPRLNHAHTASLNSIVCPDDINELYECINADSFIVTKTTGHTLDMSADWLSAISIPERLSHLEEIQSTKLALDRLLRHPIAGNVIRMMRTLKKDNSFGSVIHLPPRKQN